MLTISVGLWNDGRGTIVGRVRYAQSLEYFYLPGSIETRPVNTISKTALRKEDFIGSRINVPFYIIDEHVQIYLYQLF